MKRHVFLLLAGIVLLVFGGMFLFFTDDAVKQFVAGDAQPAVFIICKNVGVFLVALGLINFLARKSKDYAALTAIMLGTLFYLIVATTADTYWTLKGVFTSQAWGSIIIRAVFAFGYIYYLAKLEPESEVKMAAVREEENVTV